MPKNPHAQSLAARRWPHRLTTEQTQREVRRLLAAGRSKAAIAAVCGIGDTQTVNNWLHGKTRGPEILKELK